MYSSGRGPVTAPSQLGDGAALAVDASGASRGGVTSGAPFAVEHLTIRDGDAGTADTVDLMAGLIRDGAVDPLVRRQAIAIIAGTAPRDYDAQLAALRAWVSRHVVFLRDPTVAELLHSPRLMVQSIMTNPSGVIHVDCDDVAILAGALGMSIGLLCRIVTVAFRDPTTPAAPVGWLTRILRGFDGAEPYAHTWSELSCPVGSPQWCDMDTTRSTQGVDPSLIARSFIVEV